MEQNPTPEQVADDVVVGIHYSLSIDGEVVDSTEDDDPLEFLQGHQNIIPGLEKELYGLTIGSKKTVKVLAENAYGQIDPEAVIEVPRDQFPADIPMELGLHLQVLDSDGEEVDAHIAEIKDDVIVLDFNHPLAGQDLVFDLEVVSLRQPTEEEMAHGHVHGEDHDDGEWEEDDEYDDDEDGDLEEEDEV